MEKFLISLLTPLLKDLAAWLFKKAADLLDEFAKNKKVSNAVDEAVKNNDPGRIDDLVRNMP